MSSPRTKHLYSVSPGNRGKVVSLNGGDGFRDMMQLKGMSVGAVFQVRSAGMKGHTVVQVADELVEIGSGQAKKITVVEYVSLKDLQPGQRGCVAGFNSSDEEYRHKLLRMGIIRGAEFTLVRKAPFGDPLEIKLGDYNLTLRAKEAEAIDIGIIE